MNRADRHPSQTGADTQDEGAPMATPGAARRRRPLLARKRLIAGLMAAAGVALFAALDGAPHGAATAAAPKEPPPVRSAWIEIHRPLQLYGLALPGFEGASSYEARRHEPGGGRRDALVLGRWESEGPYMRLSVYRQGAEAAPPAALYIETVRRAAELGLAVTRSGQPDRLATRFGAFEVADMRIEGQGRDHACLGFRLAGADGAVTLSGFSCGSPAQPIQRGQLMCQIDRLDLISAGEDSRLRDFFVEAERRRDESCAPNRLMRQTAAWMEPQGAPALRGPAVDAEARKQKGKRR
ncbi:MAG: hypothetical protein LCH88_09530 [Proteobacteria bacterium]|nr:hypothetical protein [Pseudomonadota bacterium]